MVNRRYEDLTKCQTDTAESTIKEAAEKQDTELLTQIRGIKLQAKECQNHSSCRRDYIRSLSTNRRKSQDELSFSDREMNEAHVNAFEHFCEHVDKSIVKGPNVERMTMLREKYLRYMNENGLDFYNPMYKTQILKDKLKKRFASDIQFWAPNYRSELLYANNIPKGQAVETAFENAASDERLVEDVALILRRCILDYKENQSFTEWPPTAKSLLAMSGKIPTILCNFLTLLISGKRDAAMTNKTERLANSFRQDTYSSVTNGKLKMPKQLLLGITLRHMTGSAELMALMNNFGHCQSYSQEYERKGVGNGHV